MTLAGQRGDIDCGGLRYLVVAYGNFWQLVIPTGHGSHVSVAVESDADPIVLPAGYSRFIEGHADHAGRPDPARLIAEARKDWVNAIR